MQTTRLLHLRSVFERHHVLTLMTHVNPNSAIADGASARKANPVNPCPRGSCDYARAISWAGFMFEMSRSAASKARPDRQCLFYQQRFQRFSPKRGIGGRHSLMFMAVFLFLRI